MPLELVIMLLVGLVISIGALVVLLGFFNVFSASTEVNERLETYAAIPDEAPRRVFDRRRAQFIRARLRINSMMSVLTSEELNLRLLSANWPITESEFVLIRFWSIVAGFLAGWLFSQSILPGIGVAIIAFLIPDMLLRRAIYNRRLKFERQLVDVLVLVKGAVRSGYSFLQALDVVIEEMRAPASEEFRRVRREVGLGLPMSQALNNLNSRMENGDLYLVVTAVNINSQVGGNLSTMLEAVTTTIRERVRLFSEIRALTSQQRYSGYFLTMLPFIVAAALFIINPEYISRIFEPGWILCVPIGAVLSVFLGNIMIRLLARMDV
jgi:tight adherence protein B